VFRLTGRTRNDSPDSKGQKTPAFFKTVLKSEVIHVSNFLLKTVTCTAIPVSELIPNYVFIAFYPNVREVLRNTEVSVMKVRTTAIHVHVC